MKEIVKIPSVHQLYCMILIFLLLGTVNVPVAARIAFMVCFLAEKRSIRIIPPVIFSVGYFLVFHQESVMVVYLIMIAVTVVVMECKKEVTNELFLLLSSMCALSVADFISGHFIHGMKSTYVGWEGFPACLCRIVTIFLLIGAIRILYLFIKKMVCCGCIVYGFFYLLNIVNYWVLEITGKEFLLSDVKLAKTVAGVMNNVQVQKDSMIHFMVSLVVMIVFFIGFWFAGKRFLVKDEDSFRHGAFYLIMIVSFFVFLKSGAVELLNYSGSLRYGVVCNLAITAEKKEKPTGYQAFMDEVNQTEEPETADVESKPNIIVIMNEAFTDLQLDGTLETNKDYMPFTRSLLSETPSGILYSSVFGNNTVSSEMEFLTGIPTGLTMKGCDFYQAHLDETEDSIVSLLKKRGYTTTGIHPYNGAGYNRENAWKAFGFDQICFQEDFPKDAKKIRDYISDEAFYEKIIACSEASEEPQFIFGISMQNHATYLDGYKGEISVKGMDYPNADEYLSLIYESDKALEKLINYYKNQEKETIIVFFGDHQPLIDTDFYSEVIGKDYFNLSLDEQALTYQVPYFIWSNYKNDYRVPEKISINYLPAVTLDTAGIPKDKWFSFVSEAQERFPIITDHFIEVNGELKEKDAVKKQLKKITSPKDLEWNLLKKYQVWAYDKAY